MLELPALDEQSATPLYRQLYDHIAVAIRSGVLAGGHRLPATRELAGQLGLNRTTVSAAYELLEADGLIDGQVGRGSYVRGVNARGQAPAFISFASSRPSQHDFPLADFQATCEEVIHGPQASEILQLGSPSGYPPLREYLKAEVPEGDDVLVTSGCQQALDLIQRVLAPGGETVLVEDPVYHGLRNVFARGGARIVGAPVTNNGLDMQALEKLAERERPRLLLVTPNFQNPTGTTLPLEARRRILALGITVVENDIYGDLRYTGTALPRLKEIDPSAGSILLRSFSKVAFPGLRVGWVVAPRPLIARLTEAKQWSDLHSDQLSQAILLRFAESGRLKSHLDVVRSTGEARLRAVLRACETYLPEGSAWTQPEGGLNIWIRLPEPLDAAELLPRAERAGITYLPGRTFAVGTHDPGTLRLSFGALSAREIDRGIEVLGKIFHDELAHAASRDRFGLASALV